MFKENKKMKSTEMSVDEVSTKGMKSGGMPMVMKDGKKIPAFAAKKGGMPKMNMGGAMTPEMGMKSGGKTKKMAMGGGMPMGALPGAAAAAAPAMGRAAPPMGRGVPARPPMAARKPNPRQAMMEAMMAEKAAPQAPMMRKKGGMAESDKAQDKAMISKAFKQHDMQEHKGGKGTELKLKNGGMKGYATGGVVNGAAGYKEGGFAKMMCEGGSGHKAMKKGGSF